MELGEEGLEEGLEEGWKLRRTFVAKAVAKAVANPNLTTLTDLVNCPSSKQG